VPNNNNNNFFCHLLLAVKIIIFYNLDIILNNEGSVLESFFQIFSMAGRYFFQNFMQIKK
jgi:hypothetical protein